MKAVILDGQMEKTLRLYNMICLRCGYCCIKYMVVIVDDPDKGIVENRHGIISDDNLLIHEGDGPCKHLEGNKPGEYSCKVHDRKWYKKTPCFSHGQIEENENCECRLGRYILNKGKENA